MARTRSTCHQSCPEESPRISARTYPAVRTIRSACSAVTPHRSRATPHGRRLEPEQMTPAVPGVFGLQGTLAVRCHQQISLASTLVYRVLAVPQHAAQGRLADLVSGRHRQVAREPDQPRRPLDAEVGLLAEEGAERAGVEVATGELERRHDLVPGDRVGDGVDGGCGHTGEAA